jgi:hypothetical protein
VTLAELRDELHALHEALAATRDKGRRARLALMLAARRSEIAARQRAGDDRADEAEAPRGGAAR